MNTLNGVSNGNSCKFKIATHVSWRKERFVTHDGKAKECKGSTDVKQGWEY